MYDIFAIRLKRCYQSKRKAVLCCIGNVTHKNLDTPYNYTHTDMYKYYIVHKFACDPYV